MLQGKRVCVVMPAYNAAATLERTVHEIDRDVVDDIILVDDNSPDGTAEIRSSSADLGQGLQTVLAQFVAEELGLPDPFWELTCDIVLAPAKG